MVKRIVKNALRRADLEIRRLPRQADSYDPPPLYEDLVEAMYRMAAGQHVAISCPLLKFRSAFGFGFDSNGWHPFTAISEELYREQCTTYADSVLKKYYNLWQPSNAREAVVGFAYTPLYMKEFPAFAFVPPWDHLDPAKRADKVTQWYRKDFLEHKHKNLDIATHGHKMYGPVSDIAGQFEFERCRRLHASLAHGYDRSRGDIKVLVVKRGGETIFTGGKGLHRRAIMKALGFEMIPAIPQHPVVIDVTAVDHWPQVRSGLWSRIEALKYVDHLIDFDSLAWAEEHGLARSRIACRLQ